MFLMACSAAFEQVKEIEASKTKTFHQHLLNNYKQNASFEAEKMHDWNSAKLYSEKALRAQNSENIYPEKIEYWKIPQHKIKDIKSGYNNLLSIYDESIRIDPVNLAKAISSLDCWAEQEEEKWQTWDIAKCKDDFHSSMHKIYDNISREKTLEKNTQKLENKENNIAIVTQNNEKEIMQIIYFDYDNSELSDVSKISLINFLDKNKNNLKRYIILGHTDTKGTKIYNLKLSFNRAEAMKKILLNQGISEKNISILGKGEDEPAVITPDETKHPANRRAEIKILN